MVTQKIKYQREIEEEADCIYQNHKEYMKNTNILLQKKIKERDISKNSSKLKENNLDSAKETQHQRVSKK